MWMICYIVERDGKEDDAAAEARARALFPRANFIAIGPKIVRPFVKADLDFGTAGVLAANPKLLGGSASLCWIQEGAEGDVGRAIQNNQQRGMAGECGCASCATLGDRGRPSAGHSLEQLLKELADVPGKMPPPAS